MTAVYSINEMYDYIKNTRGYSGMDSEPPRELTIQSAGAGSTTPWDDEMLLGGTEAQSDEVAYHEYLHNVIYSLYGENLIQWSGADPDYNAAEAAAMDEGFSDYFSCALKGDHTYGGPVNITDGGAETTFPLGANNGTVTRFLYNTLTMNNFNDSTHPHFRALILTGATWRLRIAIGTDADELAFKALQITPQPQSFESFRTRMFAADDYYNNDANQATIEQKFTERYIGGPLTASMFYATLDGNDFPVLHWTDRSVVEDGYRVERKFNSGGWSVIDDLAANTTQYTDNDYRCLGGGTGTYYYRIQGYYENPSNPDEISYSPEISIDLSTCDVGPSPRIAQNNLAPEAGTLNELPETTVLEAAYPNPFNPQTTIRYVLSEAGPVRLVVSDVLGREVVTLVEGTQEAGSHEAAFDAAELPSGLYLYRLETGTGTFSRTMMLAK